jgi:hypothetical protein
MHVEYYAYTDDGPKYIGNYANWPTDFPLPNIGEETLYEGKIFLVSRKQIDPLFNSVQLYTITSASEWIKG